MRTLRNICGRKNVIELLPVHKLKLKFLRLIIFKELTEWEKSFIRDIFPWAHLSEKQVNKIDEIYDRVRFNKLNPAISWWRFFQPKKRKVVESVYSPYSEELGVSYNDVHDFDK